MSFAQILRLPREVWRSARPWLLLGALALALATIYPSDLDRYRNAPPPSALMPAYEAIDTYGRFVNTALQLGIPLLLRDATGLRQLAVITLAGVVASHGPKRLLNDVEVLGTRLGERPWAPDSRHNMPSGHSTLAASGAYFVMRRYSWKFGLIVVPILLMTMAARVALDAHTVSAVIAGALTGLLVTALFTTRYRAAEGR